jgi:hypothetical protein
MIGFSENIGNLLQRQPWNQHLSLCNTKTESSRKAAIFSSASGV